jgi:hypothetical protein
MGQEQEHYQQELFEYLANELDVITLQGQMHDIETIVLNMNQQTIQEDKEEFAIGFAEWFTNEKSKYSIMYGNQEKRFSTFKKDYTAKELLEIYKKEKL